MKYFKKSPNLADLFCVGCDSLPRQLADKKLPKNVIIPSGITKLNSTILESKLNSEYTIWSV